MCQGLNSLKDVIKTIAASLFFLTGSTVLLIVGHKFAQDVVLSKSRGNH